ncbi:M20 metallopeptidase family protein [Polluticoccus soli]|uniref:M20 metallopeptidase family protein n=1 Tax=Polluticoccus soli TaxID=3034150 RepID=UPI0023E2F0A3|nr:M20 family metallopeptidase [Flavipsychrobacter sp. JY13-12]
MINRIREKAEQYFPEVQAIRHHIHSNPELSFEEYNTSAFISDKLTSWGIQHNTGIAGTGIVALIHGKNPNKKCIALRADMDALPIYEKNDVSYRSKNDGVMHACGHDVHSSCLLGAARILHELRDEWEGTIKLIFQPGEEKHPGGASLMIEAGVMENPKPDAIFALHVYPHLPCGTAGFRAGQYMASADEIYITIEGKGGHAALPHQTVDPIAIAAQVITNLQQVISRKGNPLIPSVLTFGKIAGGFATNVIPDQVEILGTLRTMDETWRYKAHEWIKNITEQICEANGAKVKVEIPQGYPSLYNDPTLTTFAETWAREYVGVENVHVLDMRMAAEDFSFYTLNTPGCFFRIGTNTNDEKFTAPVHNAHFDIDENAMKTGVGLFSWIALQAIGKH